MSDVRKPPAGADDWVGLPPAHDEALRQRIVERVRRSALAHRGYVTIRDVAPAAAGARRLYESALTRSDLVALGARDALPWADDVLAQELLVVGGTLELAGDAPLGRGDHVVLARGVAVRAGAQGASVFARQRLADEHTLVTAAPLEAHWWRLALAAPRVARSTQRRWTPTTPGVAVQALAGDTTVCSMLVRFDAGASVADHHHEVDEDCLVLDGEMFLGDILLRAGDYQLAPAGGGHWGEMSDVGCTFYFHGSIDPVLLGR